VAKNTPKYGTGIYKEKEEKTNKPKNYSQTQDSNQDPLPPEGLAKRE
jgi:hypothetical protein